MAWSARTRDEIRDTLLADWAARAEAVERPIDVREGAPYWLLAGALALVLESQEAQLDTLARELLPDTATGEFLDRHAAVEGIARTPAVKAVLEVGISGTPSTIVAFGTALLVAPDGTRYVPSANADGTGTSVGLSVGGGATIYATAQTAGAEANQPTATIVSWSSTPANANPTGVVTDTNTAGADTESDGAFALRVLARRQERPASGNRADWVEWAEQVTGVDTAVVYPLLHPTYGAGTLGSLTLVPLGPPQGYEAVNTRIVSSDVLDRVAGFIEGENDATGSTTGVLRQLRPVVMRDGDYFVEAAGEQVQDLDLIVTLAGTYAAPFAYDATLLVLAASTSTSVILAGDVRATITTARDILVDVGAPARGGYVKVRPTAVGYDGVNTTATVPTLPDAPLTGRAVLPAPPNWDEIRAAIFNLFDGLGPGDTVSPSRWPGQETSLRSTLYKSAIAAALVAQYDSRGALVAGVRGVLNAEVVTPASDVTPPAKSIVTLGKLMVRPA